MDIGKISIIIPVYNTEKYIEKCVTSILRQSYKNIEIILVDDGSTDNSLVICNELAKTDSRIIVVTHENGGPSKARNLGLRRMTGEYIAFVDSDDFLEDDTVYERLMTIFNENSALQAVFFSAKIVREKERTDILLAGNDEIVPSDRIIKGLIQDNLIFGGGYPWNKIWKKTRKEIFFDESICAYEDKVWALEQLNNMDSVYLSSIIGYDYVVRENSLVHEISRETERYKNDILAYRKIRDMYIENRFFFDVAQDKYFSLIFLDAWRAVKNKNYGFLALLADDYQKEVKKKRIKGLKERIKHLIIMFYIKKACKDKK